MIRYARSALATLVLLAVCSSPAAAQRQVRIGIVTDGKSTLDSPVVSVFKKEILALTADEFMVEFPKDRMLVANWTVGSVRKALDELLADKSVDIILAIGILSGQEASRRRRLNKPVFAPFAIDTELQGLPYVRGVSGKSNFTYLVRPGLTRRDIKVFHEIVAFKHLAVVANKSFLDAVPGIRKNVNGMVKALKSKATVITADMDADAVLKAIPKTADAVFVGPLLRMPAEQFQKLVAGINERGLPSFAGLGVSDAKRGLLLANSPEADMPNMARRLALGVQMAILGEDPARLEVGLQSTERLTLNMKTAREIGFAPTWAVLTEAELLNAQREGQSVERLTLKSVVKLAVERNLDLYVADREVAVARSQVGVVRGNLLPQVTLNLDGNVIDSDRAAASFGSQSEWTVSGGLMLTQLIYSQEAWNGYRATQYAHDGTEQQRQSVRLDIVYDATVAYLNVLRAQTAERIQRENLRRTRTHLEIARIRKDVGASGLSDVYRWEAEIANNRRDVINAGAQRNQAEIALNRIMNRELEQSFVAKDVGLDAPYLITSDERIFEMLNNPSSFKQFRAFMAERALENAPELKGIDAGIKVNELNQQLSRRAFWVPTVALQAQLNYLFGRFGEGSEPSDTSALPPQFAGLFADTPDDFTFFVGISLQLPLLEGASRFSELDRADDDLVRAMTERSAAAQRVEQRVRSALHASGASHAAIALTAEAATASEKALDLAVEAYTRGAIPITQVVDSQNTALVARLVASNAVYDFLVDLMGVQRAVGRFDFDRTEEERRELIQRLSLWMAQQKEQK